MQRGFIFAPRKRRDILREQFSDAALSSSPVLKSAEARLLDLWDGKASPKRTVILGWRRRSIFLNCIFRPGDADRTMGAVSWQPA